MTCFKTPVIIALCFSFLTCGIDELYYLPQLPENRIVTEFNTQAEIKTDSLSQIYYATGYAIYYKIYFNNNNDITVYTCKNNDTRIINTRIYGDYSALYPYTDPTNATIITTSNTFSNRGFYELELENNIDIRSMGLSTSGTGNGTFIIQFPTRTGDPPFIVYNGVEHYLFRSNDKGAFTPVPDRYFRNSVELRDSANAIPTVNADVFWQNDVNDLSNAYVSMYIVAVGQDPKKFSRLYGKPTHINIFLLPSWN